jgi:drug/metabolite transporter (DMT)-like permease
LAIRFAVESIPPLALIAIRCFGAGLLLFSWSRLRGDRLPTRKEWREAFLVGALFFLGCHGTLSWAEQHVPSSLAALLLATIPLFMVALESATDRATRPNLAVCVGLLLGFAGTALLVSPNLGGADSVDPVAATLLLVGSLCWAAGSLTARSGLPASTVLAAAFVNPIVAVLLGCLLGGEALTGRTAAACVCVVGHHRLLAAGAANAGRR